MHNTIDTRMTVDTERSIEKRGDIKGMAGGDTNRQHTKTGRPEAPLHGGADGANITDDPYEERT